MNDGREPSLGLGGQHRAEAQRRIKRGHQAPREVGLCLVLQDRRMRWVAKMAVPQGPVSGRTDVGMGTFGIRAY